MQAQAKKHRKQSVILRSMLAFSLRPLRSLRLIFLGKSEKRVVNAEQSRYNFFLRRTEQREKVPVAQLDRASVYGTEGRGFESLRAHH